ncbi:S41 family peptidase [Pseudoalteromonas sp.]|uniref:S41 family peptidase n=1 Tax=Pseudoalteromonas sp. TaxID=53249 RepID=UPI002355E97F|nr:S41 family peptidase [Pseudoalteromonas sp.]
MKNILLVYSIIILSACSNVQRPSGKGITQTQAKHPPAGDLIEIEDLQKDLLDLSIRLNSIHPEPGFTMDLAEVELQIDKLSIGISTPMTQLESWKYLSQLNPYFQDGHMMIAYPNANKHMNTHIDNGGRIFPVKVQIDESYRLHVTDTKNVEGGIKVGDEIVSINGVAVSVVVKSILSRMHGDTEELRRALASDRFAKMYWMLYGDKGYYQIAVINNNRKRFYSIIGSNKNGVAQTLELGDIVKRKILANGIGYLRIDRFYYAPEHETAFFQFMNESWQEFHDAKVQDVIIDVRKNPGGTDHYWQQGIAPYVANEPFLFSSKLKIRITERNLRLGPIKGDLGSIIEAPFDQLVPVDGHDDLRITGTAYLLMGPLSYSSTILFLTAFQDSNQAVIAGQSGGARSCTTGRIDISNFSGSKLELVLPTLIFTRPSGKDLCHQPIKPDLFIADDPSNPAVAVTKLAKLIVAKR